MPDTQPAVITTDPDAGQTVSVVGDTYRIVMSGAQTGNSFAAIDMLIPPGGGPAPHAHPAIQESFYVVEGEILVRTKDRSYTARAGSFVSVWLGGIVHSFKNVSDTTAHLLCIVVPAGMDALFLEIGKPVAPGAFLPPPEMTPEAMEKLRGVAERYGQELYPPDYLD